MSNFMESYDFSGKTVIPFCTSGSTGIGTAVKTLRAVIRGKAVWRAGKRFDEDASKKEVTAWVSSFRLQGERRQTGNLSTTVVPAKITASPSAQPSIGTPDSVVSPEPSVLPESSSSPEASVQPETTLTPEPKNKVLVVYFSCTGSTKGIAEKIAEAADADIWEITPEIPYTSADLNYNDSASRASVEQRDASARPGISGSVENMSQYSVVFLGYPIWHGKAPRVMDTFVESYDFSDKIVVPFCTSASSGIGNSAVELQMLASKNATWISGRRFAGSDTKETVAAWVQELDLEKMTEGKEKKKRMNIQVGTVNFTVELADNSSARALAEKLAEEPVTISMHDYGNFEKVGPLGFDLPRNDEQITTEPGDIILYLGNQITIYYDTNSWNFTRLGKIQNATAEELKSALGSGDVTVTLSME